MEDWIRPRSHKEAAPWVLLIALVATLLAFWVLSHSLGRSFSLEWLLPPEERRPFQALRDQLRRPDDLVVLVSGATQAERETFVDELAAGLEQDHQHFADILSQLDAGSLRPSLLYYLPPDQLARLEQALAPLAPRLRQPGTLVDLAQDPALQSAGPLAAQLHRHYLRLLEKCLDTRGQTKFPPPWLDLVKIPMPDTAEQLWEGRNRLYLTSNPGTNLILVCPQGDPLDSLASLHRQVSQACQHNPRVIARVSGSAALAIDQARAMLSQGRRIGPWIALAMILLFLQGGHRPLRLLLAFVSAALGMLWGLAYCLWLLGRAGLMVLVSLPLAVALAGSLALLAAYQRSGLRTFQAASLLASSFLSVTMIGFPAASELCLALSLASLACALALATVYPALLAVCRRGPAHVSETSYCELSRPRASLTILVALLVTAFCLSHQPAYNTDIIGLFDPRAESLQPEMELEDQGHTAIYAQLTVANLEEARALLFRLNHLKSVGQVMSLPVLLPSQVPQKIGLVTRICSLCQGVQTPRPIPLGSAADLLALWKRLEHLQGAVSHDLAGIGPRLAHMGPGPIQEALQAFQNGLLLDLDRLLLLMRAQQSDPPSLTRLDPHLRSRLVSPSGRLSVMVFPRLPPRSADARSTFLGQLRAVSPDFAGPAVLLSRLGRGCALTARRAPWVASLMLLVASCCWLGSIPRGLLAMVVPSLGVIWTGGWMYLAHVDLTPLNWPALLIAQAMGAVLGLEVARKPEARQIAWAPHLVAMVGFLTMSGARHPLVASLGFVAGFGLAANIVVAATVVPALEALARRALRRLRG